MFKLKQRLNKFRDNVFSNIHGNNLVYNICWEDPRCDREMLHFDQDSKIVMITSAGCNALDYMLDNPQAVHAIDVNSRQNALLKLKLALFEHGDFASLFKYFGEGAHPDAKKYYQENLKAHLPEYATEFWDKKMKFFDGKGMKKSFYFHGTSGTFAWYFKQYLKTRPKLKKLIFKILDARNLEEQKEIYEKIEPKLLNFFLSWILNRHFTLALLGVPRAQRRLIVEEFPKEKMKGYMKMCLRQVFTELPIQDNYFWYLYIKGNYSKTCCPNYLLEGNFETLKERAKNIHLHTKTVAQFLKDNPDKYSHYILLDHQDWLAAHDVPALEEEWKLILENSRPGTKILIRSAALKIDFFPKFVTEALSFDEEAMKVMHKKDRVGTYGSMYLATVK